MPVLVGTFSYLLWGTCHGTQDLKYYDDIKYILPWIYNNVPKSETCEFGRELQDKRKKKISNNIDNIYNNRISE